MVDGIVRDYTAEQKRRTEALYVAACLRMMTLNTAKAVKEGVYMQAKLEDILNPKPKDERSAEEIIAHIKSKLRKGAQE